MGLGLTHARRRKDVFLASGLRARGYESVKLLVINMAM